MNLPKVYHGFKVVKKDSRVLKDYAGMNYYAAKSIGFKPVPKTNEIWVDDRLHSKQQIKKNVVHEVVEASLMKKKHCSYWTAHQKALLAEKKVR